MIRQRLQSGDGRKTLGLLAGTGAGLLVICVWPKVLAWHVDPLSAAQKVAFVAAAFSATAYNLRTRVLDLVMKIEGTPSRIAQLCTFARGCGRKLTNLVILFTITALLMAGGGFIPVSHRFGSWYTALATGLFISSCVHFVYVLFAFERFERYLLDDAEEKARSKDARRLFPDATKS